MNRGRVLVLIYAALWVALVVLGLFARAYPYFAWDLQWTKALQAVSLPGLAPVMFALTWLGDRWHPYVVVALVAGALALAHKKRIAVAVIASDLGGQLFNALVKLMVQRPRPAESGLHIMRHRNTLSFPSGHVTHFMALYGFLFVLALLYMRPGVQRASIFVVLGALLIGIGLSRVYVGEHWPSDVIGGYLAGLCWLGVVVTLYRKWHGDQHQT